MIYKNLLIVIIIFYICVDSYANNLKYTNGENLGILIMGTITNTENSEKNVALLKHLTQNKIYAVKKNFVILNKYKVLDISSKYIVISDAVEAFLIYQNKFASEFLKYNEMAQQTTHTTQDNTFQDTYKEDGFERIKNKITISSQYKEAKILKNLPTILMEASSLPVVQNGKIIGFQIFNINPQSIFINAGLQNHDIITAINGKPLEDAASAIKILQSLKDESSINVDIVRNNQNFKLYINIQ